VRQQVTIGIVLRRTDYGEADRILTLLTPDQGKLRLMAKGVRRIKSKLAGGIELFSVSHVTYIQGRKDIGTLISARLDKHYGNIVKDIQRTMLAYELIKRLDKATEDEPEPEYFELLQQCFVALDDVSATSLELVQLWFMMQLLRIGGHMPNLQTNAAGGKLSPDERYGFSFEDMAFAASPNGPFTANHIKFLRLGFAGHPPKALGQIQGSAGLVSELLPIVQTMLQTHVRS
jgi:DNA repair protein RecO (recombination protein O)